MKVFPRRNLIPVKKTISSFSSLFQRFSFKNSDQLSAPSQVIKFTREWNARGRRKVRFFEVESVASWWRILKLEGKSKSGAERRKFSRTSRCTFMSASIFKILSYVIVTLENKLIKLDCGSSLQSLKSLFVEKRKKWIRWKMSFVLRWNLKIPL